LQTRIQFLAATSFLLIAGCSQNASKIEIAGDVTFQGKPIENGTITFLDATTPDASTALRAAGTITNGHYKLEATPGEKIVAIEEYEFRPDPVAATDSYPGSEPPEKRVQLVPERYNAKSELRYTVISLDESANFAL
jgi:hypothetical protein